MVSRETASRQADSKSIGTLAGSVAARGKARTTMSIPANVDSGNADFGGGFRDTSGDEMPQPALHPIAYHRVPEGPVDDKANARRRAASAGPHYRITIGNTRSMDNQSGPTDANAAPGRPLEVLGAAHSQ